MKIWIVKICISFAGNVEMCQEKILIMFSHIKNDHAFPKNKFFNQWEYAPLDKDARKKLWITEGDIIKNEYD